MAQEHRETLTPKGVKEKRKDHMEEGRPSLTAVVAAMMRAAHVLLDDEPKILRDDLALGLSEIEHEAALRKAGWQ